MNKLKLGTEPDTDRSDTIIKPRYIYKLDQNKMIKPIKFGPITLI